jgi:hypothetical protein
MRARTPKTGYLREGESVDALSGGGCGAFYKRGDYERILGQDAVEMRNRLETRAFAEERQMHDGMSSVRLCGLC